MKGRRPSTVRVVNLRSERNSKQTRWTMFFTVAFVDEERDERLIARIFRFKGHDKISSSY
jgi:hypothetical protein